MPIDRGCRRDLVGLERLKACGTDGVDRVDRIEALSAGDFGDHLERSLQRLADAVRQRRGVVDRFQLLSVEVHQTAIGEWTSRTSTVAIVVDAGDEERIGRAGDEPIEFS
jgi:hypothetical protein